MSFSDVFAVDKSGSHVRESFCRIYIDNFFICFFGDGGNKDVPRA